VIFAVDLLVAVFVAERCGHWLVTLCIVYVFLQRECFFSRAGPFNSSARSIDRFQWLTNRLVVTSHVPCNGMRLTVYQYGDGI